MRAFVPKLKRAQLGYLGIGNRRVLGQKNLPDPSLWLPFNDAGNGAVDLRPLLGVGSATFTRAGATATTILSTGRVSPQIAANTARSYYDPTTLQYLGYLAEEARTNDALWARDLTNAVWAKTLMTTAQTSVGNDGNANSATRCTATAGNATALQTLTAAAVNRTYAVDIRRVTGSGNIQITSDNGTTWTTCSGLSSVVYTRYTFTQSVLNPVFGIRIVTSGDAVDVDYNQIEMGAFATSRIPTTTASVARVADSLQFPTFGNVSGTAGTCAALVSFGGDRAGRAVVLSDVAERNALYGSGGGVVIGMFDGANIVNGPSLSAVNVQGRYASRWSGSAMQAAANGVAGTAGTFDGNFDVGTNMGVGFAPAFGAWINGTIRNLRVWQTDLGATALPSL